MRTWMCSDTRSDFCSVSALVGSMHARKYPAIAASVCRSSRAPAPRCWCAWHGRSPFARDRPRFAGFKPYNAKNPERGGARKLSYGANKEEAARTYEGIRKRWATVQNLALEQAGVEARVDHRTLAAQGIHREPEVHRGPAVSGIEARGERSQVGERQREQM